MRVRPFYALLLKGFIFSLLLTVDTATAQSDVEKSFLAPDFVFQSGSGEVFNFYDRLQTQKKPTLVYFWATWCPYCRKATPKVVALHQHFSQAIDVLAINVGINDSPERMAEYVHSYQMDFPVMFDKDSEISQQFHVFGTPVFVIVSDSGEIMYRSHRYPAGIEDALSPPAQQ
ncbi:TlpA family protein disulfide reductase [Planctobacterium marinum]|uniref:TlpA family protein disulfide reductase n=1 Tax=Planctobacterium marinum TaxID=1631968 RepID=UPI001E64E718|nr:TlpA disulfide reductase family protein [Planctobacterium marinum]MCC2606521.1 TlpA family protein disulfide reductase [Planctobacterium marinum]